MNSYKIAEARIAKGWSQREFAQRLGTTQQQVARYESGENDVKSSVVIRMSKVLGVTISYLLGLEDVGADATLAAIEANYRSMSGEGRAALLAASEGLAARFGNECPPPADLG